MRSERWGPDETCWPFTKSRYRLSAETWTTKCSGRETSSNVRRKWKTPYASRGAVGGEIPRAGGGAGRARGPRGELDRPGEGEDAVRLARSGRVRDPAGGGGVGENAGLGPP